MKIYKYNWGKYHQGAYIQIGKENAGYYNVLLFVKAYSKRIKTGRIIISNKPFKNSIKIVKLFYDSSPFSNYYWIEDNKKEFIFKGISIDFCPYKAKTLYIYASPDPKLNKEFYKQNKPKTKSRWWKSYC